jgi:diacylglycerol kinase family enzyme
VSGHATLIVSPLASRIRDASTRRRVVEGVRVAAARRGLGALRVVETGVPAEIRKAAAAAVGDGSGLVVIAGGDGTVRDASAPLTASGVPVGIVPCGTGNLFATAVRLPRDIRGALAALETGRPTAFDAARVRFLGVAQPGGDGVAQPGGDGVPGADGIAGAETDGEPDPGADVPGAGAVPFVVACGTGFDARMIGGTSREMKRRYGVAAYFLTASRLLGSLEPAPTRITVDGETLELTSVVALIANCGEVVPGVLRPRLPVEADDGLLHVFVLPKGGIVGGALGVLELLLREGAGISPSGAAARLAGRHVRIEVEPSAPTQVDGDAFPAAGLEAEITPGGLLVVRQ